MSLRAVTCFIVRSERILLQQRPAGRIWAGMLNGPGGKADPGETSADAVVREVLEETGLRIIDPQQRGSLALRIPEPRLLQMEVDIFVATNFEGDAVELEGELAWYDREALPFDAHVGRSALLGRGCPRRLHGRAARSPTDATDCNSRNARFSCACRRNRDRGRSGCRLAYAAHMQCAAPGRRSGIRVTLPFPPSEAARPWSCPSLVLLAGVVSRAKPRSAVAVVERLDDGCLPAADGDHILLEIAGRAVAGRIPGRPKTPRRKARLAHAVRRQAAVIVVV